MVRKGWRKDYGRRAGRREGGEENMRQEINNAREPRMLIDLSQYEKERLPPRGSLSTEAVIVSLKLLYFRRPASPRCAGYRDSENKTIDGLDIRGRLINDHPP